MLRGLRTHVLQVQDLSASRDWYADLLGVAPYFDEAFYVGFSPGGFELGLHPDESPPDASSPDCPYWAVDSVPAAIRRLVERGATVIEVPHEVGGGIVVAAVRDPFGHVLGVIDNPVFDSGVLAVEPGSVVAARPGDLSDRTIVVARTLRGSPRDVWELWASSAGLAAWLLPTTKIELRIGGAYELYFMPDAPEGTRGGEGNKVLSFVPGRMLSFTWNAPPTLPTTRDQRTWVVLDFTAAEGGTRVRLEHLGWPESGWRGETEWPATFDYFVAAWDRVLDALEHHCGS